MSMVLSPLTGRKTGGKWQKMKEKVNEGKEKIMDDGERDGWRLVK